MARRRIVPVPVPAQGPGTSATDLPDARPGPLRLPGRILHREHGRPCRPPAPPRLRLTPGCLQAAPDVAEPVTWCASPTDSRERFR